MSLNFHYRLSNNIYMRGGERVGGGGVRLPPSRNDDGVFAGGVVEVETRHHFSIVRPPRWVFPASHVAVFVQTLNVLVICPGWKGI